MSYFFEIVEISKNDLYFWNEIDYGDFEFEFGKKIRQHVTRFSRIEKN